MLDALNMRASGRLLSMHRGGLKVSLIRVHCTGDMVDRMVVLEMFCFFSISEHVKRVIHILVEVWRMPIIVQFF